MQIYLYVKELGFLNEILYVFCVLFIAHTHNEKTKIDLVILCVFRMDRFRRTKPRHKQKLS